MAAPTLAEVQRWMAARILPGGAFDPSAVALNPQRGAPDADAAAPPDGTFANGLVIRERLAPGRRRAHAMRNLESSTPPAACGSVLTATSALGRNSQPPSARTASAANPATNTAARALLAGVSLGRSEREPAVKPE